MKSARPFASASEEFEKGCGSRSRNHLLRFKGQHWFCFPRDRIGRERIYDWRAGAVNFGATEDFVLNGESVGEQRFWTGSRGER